MNWRRLVAAVAVALVIACYTSPSHARSGPESSRLDAVLKTASGIPLGYDKSTTAIEMVEYEHHEVHAGSAWSTFLATDVATVGASYSVLIVPASSTKWVHLRFTYDTEGEFDVSLHEAVTVQASGTQLPTFNRNRAKTWTAETLVYSGPTISGWGTAIRSSRHGSGNNTGGGGDSQHEWVLSPGVKYALRFTRQGATAAYFSVRLWWYEHADKE